MDYGVTSEFESPLSVQTQFNSKTIIKMKTKILTKTSLILSLVIGFGASVSAAQIQYNTDGIMELPTFYIYASDQEASAEVASSEKADWTFKKSIDLEERVAVEIVLPNEERVEVYTPGISTAIAES